MAEYGWSFETFTRSGEIEIEQAQRDEGSGVAFPLSEIVQVAEKPCSMSMSSKPLSEAPQKRCPCPFSFGKATSSLFTKSIAAQENQESPGTEEFGGNLENSAPKVYFWRTAL